MKYDTVIQMPIANTTGASAGNGDNSPVQDESEKLPLLALLSNKDPSGEPESPDSSISVGESSFAGSTGTNPIQPDPTADDSPAENSGKDSTVFPLFNDPKLPAEKPVDPLEAIRALAPEVAYHMKKLLESTKTPASVKLRVLEIILERTYGKVETAVKLSSNAHQSVEASQARIAAMVEKIRFEGEQIRLMFDE